ncbi:GcrA family cell cycle regulator [Sphingomonas sp.]|uniref:GcrA family cell cycle regulator n=1 Tax=Sphingomonas sp. TaxID=28214 RepID=UPI003B3ADCEB
MLEEFRQAPLCMELDLDTYEGHWSHVVRFRGENGWLLGAEATLESATEIYRTVIVAACDEWENPIPAFQAANLLKCSWSDLGPCFEHPPELLDELLCEEEGQVYARWQRETNSALQRHLIATDERVAAVEARARMATDRLMRQINDLRRRRRFPELTIEARSIFDKLIADLDAESDAIFEDSRAEVAQIRSNATRSEEALWRREEVIIEVEPIFVVRWHGVGAIRPRNPLAPEHGAGGASLRRVQGRELRLHEERRAKEARERARLVEQARKKAEAEAAAQKEREQLALASEESASQNSSRNDLPKASPVLQKLAAPATHPTPEPSETFTQSAPPPIIEPSPPTNGKIVAERDMLMDMLAALDAKGQRFFSGSPKFRRYQEQRADLLRRIASLDGSTASLVEASPQSVELSHTDLEATPSGAWPAERVALLQKLWTQGASAADIGKQLGGVSRNAVIGKAKRLGLPMQSQAELSARHTLENGLTIAP